MNKKEKKIIDHINNQVPDVNLFNRIEGKVEYKSKSKRRHKMPIWAKVLVPTMSVTLIVGGIILSNIPFASNKNMSASGEWFPMSGIKDPNYHYETAPGSFEDLPSDFDKGDGTTSIETSKPLDSQYQKTLTACEANDLDSIEKYTFWKKMIEGTQYDNQQNIVNDYSATYQLIQNKINHLINTKNLIIISIKDKEDAFVNNAKVSLLDNKGSVIFQTYSSSKGNAYLYLPEEVKEGTKVVVNYDTEEKIIPIDGNNIPESRIYDVNLETCLGKKLTKIDIAFTIDTTGSMNDELEYITKELAGIVDRLTNKYEAYSLKIGIVLYRDKGDAYLTKEYDFSSSYSEITSYLKKQNASGGGDNPEAVEVALNKTNNLSWREDAIKLCYHVYDAPAHFENYDSLYEQYIISANKGIKLIPVICSSLVQKEFEISAREEALITGGTYVYLTNDSGIGGSHSKPTVEEAPTVEYLNDLIVRITSEYVEGIEIEPTPFGEKVDN